MLELEILAADPEDTADSLAWIGVVLLVGVLVGVFAVRRRSSGTQSLPKWTVSPTTSHEREPGGTTGMMMQRLKKTKREDESCSLKRCPDYLHHPSLRAWRNIMHARRRLAAQFRQDDLLVLASPPHAVHSNDVEYPYRTSSDLIYLTGWTEAESVFVMRYENNGWVSALFVQPKDTLKEIWEGRRPGVEGATADYAVHEAYNNHEIEDRLDEWLNDARRVFHRGGINPDLDRLVETAVRRRDRARQHFGTGPVAVEDPSSHPRRTSPEEIFLGN